MHARAGEPKPYHRVDGGLGAIGAIGGHRIAEANHARVSATAWAGLCVLVLVAPYERTRPFIQMPGQSITSVETALLLVFGVWAASMAWTRSLPRWAGSTASTTPSAWHGWPIGRATVTLPWVALLTALLIAAWGAPTNRTNALHMVGRIGLSLGVYLLTLNAITSAWRVRVVFIAAAIAGVLIGVLIVLEYVGVRPVVGVLGAFRPSTFLFGAQVRATGPFQYPTIASMYLEILFAFVSGLLMVTIDTGRHRAALVVALALLVMGEAIVLTFTRSGLICLAFGLVIVGGLRYRRLGPDAGVKALAVIAVAVAIQFVSSRSFEVLRLRLTTEGASGYAAAFDVPADLALSTGATVHVPVTVTNIGETTWEPTAPQPFRLSYHWLLEDEDVAVNWEGQRTPFPGPVRPGQRVTLQARVTAPGQPGRYRLLWDVEEERRRWFSREPGSGLFVSRTSVTGPAIGAPLQQRVSLPRMAERPGRLVLWRAAARMLAEHPLRGVGPDNFRLLYGPYAGLAHADPRIHSNNMYVELLVGGGGLAGLALAWFVARAARLLLALSRGLAPVSEISTLSAAVLAAGAAIALHGLVDSFLSVTATYVLIAITLGLASACGTLGASHANRV